MIKLMSKLSVFYCCHNRLYGSKNIDDIRHLDINIIPTELKGHVFHIMSKKEEKQLDAILREDKELNGNKSLANKIIYFSTLLKVGFKYRLENKCYCKHKITWDNDYRSGKKNILDEEDHYNLYVYLFNENSELPPEYPLHIYGSLFRKVINSSLRIMWEFGNK